MNKKIALLVVLMLPLSLFAQQEKEVLIVGTMHNVPDIVKNSYKPLLKRAIKYQPEAIYVEYIMPDDAASWEYAKEWYITSRVFCELSDSLRHAYSFRQSRFEALLEKRLDELSRDELDEIITSFAYLKDYANYSFYYRYIKQYGIKGSIKPLGNENADLSFKLALQLNINRLYSIDDQQTSKEYNQLYALCVKQGRDTGDTKTLRKLDKKDTHARVLPSLFGRLGIHINKPQSLNRKHIINSVRYVQHESEECRSCTEHWDARNSRIAKNLIQQLNRNPYKRNIVIIGAGHIVGLKEAIEKQDPTIKVKLLME